MQQVPRLFAANQAAKQQQSKQHENHHNKLTRHLYMPHKDDQTQSDRVNHNT